MNLLSVSNPAHRRGIIRDLWDVQESIHAIRCGAYS